MSNNSTPMGRIQAALKGTYEKPQETILHDWSQDSFNKDFGMFGRSSRTQNM